MRKIILLTLLLAGCPEQVGQQCPANTVAVGQYSINFAGQNDAGDACAVAQADGGPPLTPVAIEGDAGTSFGALCYGTADGGQQIYLVIPNKGVRQSALVDGGFSFVGQTPPAPGLTCDCAIGLIVETFSGSLITTPPDQPFTQPDGGIPLVGGIVGSLVDTISAPQGNTGCLCAVPCTVNYAITGTRQ
jgi:hypothetical protein